MLNQKLRKGFYDTARSLYQTIPLKSIWNSDTEALESDTEALEVSIYNKNYQQILGKFYFDTILEALEKGYDGNIKINSKSYKLSGKISPSALHHFRANTFEVAGVQTIQDMQKIKDMAIKLRLEGKTFNDFRNGIEQMGKMPKNPYHLKTNYHTAWNNSFQAAKWYKSQTNKDIFPYLEYRTQADGLVRDNHKALDGVIRHIDDNFWKIYYPTNGFNCRCYTRSLTGKEALKKGITSDTELEQRKEAVEKAIPEDFRQNVALSKNIWGNWSKKAQAEFNKPIEELNFENWGLGGWKDLSITPMPKVDEINPTHKKEDLLKIYKEKLASLGNITDIHGIPIIIKAEKWGKFGNSDKSFADLKKRFETLSLIEDIIKNPDEVWCLNNIDNNGNMGLRIKYIKNFSSKSNPDKSKPTLALTELKNGELEYFNVMFEKPKRMDKEDKKLRKGILIYSKN